MSSRWTKLGVTVWVHQENPCMQKTQTKFILWKKYPHSLCVCAPSSFGCSRAKFSHQGNNWTPFSELYLAILVDLFTLCGASHLNSLNSFFLLQRETHNVKRHKTKGELTEIVNGNFVKGFVSVYIYILTCESAISVLHNNIFSKQANIRWPSLA